MQLTGEQIVYTIFYTAISLLAIAGNGVVIYLIVNYRQMRSVTNFFILNLAIGDLLMVVLCIPFTFTSSFLLYNWPFGAWMCRLVSYSQAVSVFISAYTLVAISIDRYIAIIYPLRPRMTKAHSYQIIILIWIVSLLTPAPTALLSRIGYVYEETIIIDSSIRSANIDNVNSHTAPSSSSSSSSLSSSSSSSSSYSSTSASSLSSSPSISTLSTAITTQTVQKMVFEPNNSTNPMSCRCIEDWATWPGDDYKPIYSLMLMLLQYILPFTILVFTYTRIGLVVWGKQTPGEACGQRDAKMAASKRKMVQMMIISGTTFTLCWLPFNVLTVIGDRFSEIYQYNYIEYVWFTFHWLAMSHACYNPIIYIWMNSRYRAGFLHVGRNCFETLFCCHLACCTKDSSERDNSYPFSNSVLHVYQANTTNGRKI